MRTLTFFLSLAGLVACGSGEDSGTAEATCTEQPGEICTWLGTGLAGLGSTGMDRLDFELYLPQAVAFSPSGQPYINDWNNHRVITVRSDDTVEVVAGNGLLGDGPQGPALGAAFNHPTDLTFDPQGRLVIAAWHNSRIERVDLTTGMLEFWIGDGNRSYAGDGEVADNDITTLDLPSSVEYDEQGNLFITDQANQIIRRWDAQTGVIDRYCGQQRVQGYAGDGGLCLDAQMHASVGQAADPANKLRLANGKLYMADSSNHCVRVIDTATGMIDTFAGTGASGFSGDGGPAKAALFSNPVDVEVHPDGRVFVADTANSCVRAIGTDGTVETVAGVCGSEGYEGDFGPATDALIHKPYGITLSPEGHLYIADTYNHAFRVVYSP